MRTHPLRTLLALGLLAAPAAGEPLRLETMGGEPVSLELREGERALVVHFWATWCPECMHELPLLAAATARCAGSGVRIVAVDVGEERDAIEAYLARHAVAIPVLRDPRGRTWRSLGGVGLPTNLTWTRDGRHVDVGARDPGSWASALAQLGCVREEDP